MDAGPLIFLAAMAGIFWFLLVRPQRRRQAAHREMITGLEAGDEVITSGGMFAKVQAIADDHLVVEIAPGTEVRLAKDAVATVLPREVPEATVAEDHG